MSSSSPATTLVRGLGLTGRHRHPRRRRHRHGGLPQGPRDDVQRRHARAGDRRVGRRGPAVARRRADIRRARRDDARDRRRVRVRARGLRTAVGLPLRLDAVLHRQRRRQRGAGLGPRDLHRRAERRRCSSGHSATLPVGGGFVDPGGRPAGCRDPRDRRGDPRQLRADRDERQAGLGAVLDEGPADCRPGPRRVPLRQRRLESFLAIGRVRNVPGRRGRPRAAGSPASARP